MVVGGVVIVVEVVVVMFLVVAEADGRTLEKNNQITNRVQFLTLAIVFDLIYYTNGHF